MTTAIATAATSRQVHEPSRELRDDELEEATGGVYVGPSQSAILIALLLPTSKPSTK
jgi:hypothetical protein